MTKVNRTKDQRLTDKAQTYKERAWPLFKHQHQCNDDQCSFCAGWTWGAVSGYMAGFRAGRKSK